MSNRFLLLLYGYNVRIKYVPTYLPTPLLESCAAHNDATGRCRFSPQPTVSLSFESTISHRRLVRSVKIDEINGLPSRWYGYLIGTSLAGIIDETVEVVYILYDAPSRNT